MDHMTGKVSESLRPGDSAGDQESFSPRRLLIDHDHGDNFRHDRDLFFQLPSLLPAGTGRRHHHDSADIPDIILSVVQASYPAY